jgi:hypothetical protein
MVIVLVSSGILTNSSGCFDALVSEERANAKPERPDSWNYKMAAIKLARAEGLAGRLQRIIWVAWKRSVLT